MDKKKNLSDKELLALGKPTPKVKKKILFKQYTSKYINLGLANRDSKTIRKELSAIAKRGAYMIMRSILKDCRLPTKLKDHESPFITVIIHAGIVEKIGDKTTFVYPADGGRLEEV